jgi:hypothetical protein
MRSRFLACVGVVIAAALVFAATAGTAAATPPRTSSKLKLATKTTMTKGANGVQHWHYVYGPVHISPGQNSIFIEPNDQRPKQNGYITSFAPNLIEADGTIPRVDQIHLHHAVWLVNGSPTWGAGEEKTTARTPPGYGWTYRTTDDWRMNHMIHNLTPTPDTVYITYDMDFVPATAPAAQTMIPVHTQWMDVVGGGYPVFDAIKGTGHGPKTARRFTFPDDAPDAIEAKQHRNEWVVPHDVTLVGTAGHLHPGGLYTDMKVTRNGRTKHLFRSNAVYYEPAGAVSWDVSMTATPPNWKINLNAGDVLSISGTYDTTKASWYESMAIMSTAVANGHHGVDPFTQSFPTTGQVTHGPLAENRNHGGSSIGLPDPQKLLDGPVADRRILTIDNFSYAQGDLAATGKDGRPPVVRQGGSLTFLNNDAPPGQTGAVFGSDNRQSLPIYHTITSCRNPCNKATGIAYPIADGPQTFDSGELGYGPGGFTPAANRQEWKTPKNLPTGTYTYFCRVHPFMRGAFRVIKG